MSRPKLLPVIVIAVALGLTACSGNTSATSPPSETQKADTALALGQPNCQPASPQIDGQFMGTPRQQGATAQGFFVDSLGDELQASNAERKFVLQLEGDGPIDVKLVDPDGAQQDLLWAPVPHIVKNPDAPG